MIHLLPGCPVFILVFFFGAAFLQYDHPKLSGSPERECDPQKYVTVFTKPAYYMATWNSVKVAVIGTATGVWSCHFAALAVSALGIPARKRFMPILNMTQNFAGVSSGVCLYADAGTQWFYTAHGGKLKVTGTGRLLIFTAARVWFRCLYGFAIPLGTLLLIRI